MSKKYRAFGIADDHGDINFEAYVEENGVVKKLISTDEDRKMIVAIMKDAGIDYILAGVIPGDEDPDCMDAEASWDAMRSRAECGFSHRITETATGSKITNITTGETVVELNVFPHQLVEGTYSNDYEIGMLLRDAGLDEFGRNEHGFRIEDGHTGEEAIV